MKRDPQGDELERGAIHLTVVRSTAAGRLHEAALQLGGAAADPRVLRAEAAVAQEDERLVGGDDAAQVLEVADDGAVAGEDGGGVGEEGVEHPQVPPWQVEAPHERRLGELHLLGAARRRVHVKPPPGPAVVLVQAVVGIQSEKMRSKLQSESMNLKIRKFVD